MTYSHNPQDVDSEVKELAKQLLRMANGMSTADKRLEDLARLVANDHRTLQQQIMASFVVPLLYHWATDAREGRFDARNEATVQAAKTMIESAEFNNRLAFPFI